jgi:hypothetical protein
MPLTTAVISARTSRSYSATVLLTVGGSTGLRLAGIQI